MKIKKMFIKNLDQANFFLKEGLVPVRFKLENKDKSVAIVFLRNEKCETVFTKWIKLSKKVQ